MTERQEGDKRQEPNQNAAEEDVDRALGVPQSVFGFRPTLRRSSLLVSVELSMGLSVRQPRAWRHMCHYLQPADPLRGPGAAQRRYYLRTQRPTWPTPSSQDIQQQNEPTHLLSGGALILSAGINYSEYNLVSLRPFFTRLRVMRWNYSRDRKQQETSSSF